MEQSIDTFSLYITNTLTAKKERFESLNPDKVTLYVCGITPYDYPHLGHGRVYVTFDVLYRLLQLFGYQVIYARNFTDIDDKLLKRAQEEFGDASKYTQIADRYIAAFERDMKQLNCLPPTHEPRVTTHIKQILTFVEGLIASGHAYVVGGDVYYRIKSFPEYGKLSKRNLSELEVGSRVTVREEKEDPLDFALWKEAERSTPGWESPWGYGRPGWHIECSALAETYLGEEIDIHAGGMDLIFPHHENEVAQSEGLHNKPFARYWMHNAFVLIDKEKMSKSLGNFVTLHDILTKFNPMVIRYYYLIHHYRNPMDFAIPDIEAAAKSYQKICLFFKNCHTQKVEELCLEELPLVAEALEALTDDLNIAKFIGLFFEHMDELAQDPRQAGVWQLIMQQVLGLTLEPLPEKTVVITPEIQHLLDERIKARQERNFKRADEIRDQLSALGVDVKDTKL